MTESIIGVEFNGKYYRVYVSLDNDGKLHQFRLSPDIPNEEIRPHHLTPRQHVMYQIIQKIQALVTVLEREQPINAHVLQNGLDAETPLEALKINKQHIKQLREKGITTYIDLLRAGPVEIARCKSYFPTRRGLRRLASIIKSFEKKGISVPKNWPETLVEHDWPR